MDPAVVIFALAILLMIAFHPATKMFINYIKSKFIKKQDNETRRCFHTEGDCEDCLSSLDCPMKCENIVVPKRNKYMD